MRTTLLACLAASLSIPAVASADPARLNNPAPPTPAPAPPPDPAPPANYDAPPTVQQPGYNAPPPVTGYAQPAPAPRPVMMSQPQYVRPVQAPVAPATPARQGLFIGILGGAAIPVVGDYGEFLSTGFMGFAHVGWATPSGISVRAELGARSNSYADFPELSLTSVFYGAGLRWTSPRGTFRPYIEGLVDAFSMLASSTDTSSGPVMTTTSLTGGTGVSVGVAGGAEIDLGTNFALELCVRYDHVVLGAGDTAETGGLLNVLGGGTYYF